MGVSLSHLSVVQLGKENLESIFVKSELRLKTGIRNHTKTWVGNEHAAARQDFPHYDDDNFLLIVLMKSTSPSSSTDLHYKPWPA